METLLLSADFTLPVLYLFRFPLKNAQVQGAEEERGGVVPRGHKQRHVAQASDESNAADGRFSAGINYAPVFVLPLH
jgi:hypothetical protein